MNIFGGYWGWWGELSQKNRIRTIDQAKQCIVSADVSDNKHDYNGVEEVLIYKQKLTAKKPEEKKKTQLQGNNTYCTVLVLFFF